MILRLEEAFSSSHQEKSLLSLSPDACISSSMEQALPKAQHTRGSSAWAKPTAKMKSTGKTVNWISNKLGQQMATEPSAASVMSSFHQQQHQNQHCQQVLSWYLHQPESHHSSLNNTSWPVTRPGNTRARVHQKTGCWCWVKEKEKQNETPWYFKFSMTNSTGPYFPLPSL